VLMRVRTNQVGSQPWLATMGLHSRILDVLRLGDPFVAEQVVMRATSTFQVETPDVWEIKATQPAIS
jgi:hypothetical protein